MESYVLQITAVIEGRDLFMKRRIRPNLVGTKSSRPFLCTGMASEFKFSRQTKQRLWDKATDYKQVWTT